jgi:hypothetical protein
MTATRRFSAASGRDRRQEERRGKVFNDDVQFELVREEVPFHDDCGHYHVATASCPTDRTCTSELCCVFGGTRRE